MKKSKRAKPGAAPRIDYASPTRVPPAETLPDVLERVVLRRQLKVEDGDVVITRERVPSLNPLHGSCAPPPAESVVAGQATGAAWS